MAEKKSWRDYTSGGTQAKEDKSDKKTGSWRDYVNPTTVVGKSVTEQLNNWLTNHNNYISAYQNRYKGRKYSYEDTYVGDSADWLNSATERRNALDNEANSILAYLDQYGGHLDSKFLEEVRMTINKAKDTQYQIHTAATKDNDWWNSFGSEELVSKYGSAEEAYKASQRYDGYSKKYTGMTSDELYGLVGNMDDGEEKDWLTSYASSVDYDEKSKLDVATAEDEIAALEAEIEELDDYAFEAGDILVDYLPGSPEYDEQVAKLYGKYGGSAKAMESFVIEKKRQLEEKKRYLADAKKVQEHYRETEKWNSYTQASDFDLYASKGAAIENQRTLSSGSCRPGRSS